MKNIIAIALFAFTATTANAQGKTVNDNVVLSFNVGNPQASNARLIIRNSAGQIVTAKSITTNYCNVDKSTLSSGKYSFTVINGNQSGTGAFSIR